VSTVADDLDRELAERLRARGQRVTSQRVVLRRALHELGRHASAEQVLRAAEGRLPGLSLPTVYATLDLLEELGLARRVAAGAGPVLFDPRTDGHAHFRCRACGAVSDLDARPDAPAARRAAAAAGSRPEAVDVVVSGLCAACAERARP
jgi:Fe2+ or Zn2+ uptake regulation protein